MYASMNLRSLAIEFPHRMRPVRAPAGDRVRGEPSPRRDTSTRRTRHALEQAVLLVHLAHVRDHVGRAPRRAARCRTTYSSSGRELAIGHDESGLQDHVAPGIEPRHFEVYPDQIEASCFRWARSFMGDASPAARRGERSRVEPFTREDVAAACARQRFGKLDLRLLRGGGGTRRPCLPICSDRPRPGFPPRCAPRWRLHPTGVSRPRLTLMSSCASSAPSISSRRPSLQPFFPTCTIGLSGCARARRWAVCLPVSGAEVLGGALMRGSKGGRPLSRRGRASKTEVQLAEFAGCTLRCVVAAHTVHTRAGMRVARAQVQAAYGHGVARQAPEWAAAAADWSNRCRRRRCLRLEDSRWHSGVRRAWLCERARMDARNPGRQGLDALLDLVGKSFGRRGPTTFDLHSGRVCSNTACDCPQAHARHRRHSCCPTTRYGRSVRLVVARGCAPRGPPGFHRCERQRSHGRLRRTTARPGESAQSSLKVPGPAGSDGTRRTSCARQMLGAHQLEQERGERRVGQHAARHGSSVPSSKQTALARRAFTTMRVTRAPRRKLPPCRSSTVTSAFVIDWSTSDGNGESAEGRAHRQYVAERRAETVTRRDGDVHGRVRAAHVARPPTRRSVARTRPRRGEHRTQARATLSVPGSAARATRGAPEGGVEACPGTCDVRVDEGASARRPRVNRSVRAVGLRREKWQRSSRRELDGTSRTACVRKASPVDPRSSSSKARLPRMGKNAAPTSCTKPGSVSSSEPRQPPGRRGSPRVRAPSSPRRASTQAAQRAHWARNRSPRFLAPPHQSRLQRLRRTPTRVRGRFRCRDLLLRSRYDDPRSASTLAPASSAGAWCAERQPLDATSHTA